MTGESLPWVNFIDSQIKVNSRVSPISGRKERDDEQLSAFGERLLFAIWLAGKVLGVENAKDFAEAIGKDASQLSRWMKESPRPSWGTIKKIADSLGINAQWLDEPTREGASVPDDFPVWLAARRRREAEMRQRVSGEL